MMLQKIEEKVLRPMSGFVMLFVILIGFILSTYGFVLSVIWLADRGGTGAGILMAISIIGWIVFSILCAGLKVVRPNEARVFTLFGAYYGTVNKSGFYFVNPFCISFSPEANAAKAEAEQRTKDAMKQGKLEGGASTFGISRAISLKLNACDNGLQKVNDVLGNPIMIGAVVIWRVENPTQAVFAIENYKEFISIQSDSAVRNVARLYPYDVFNEEETDESLTEKTLRGSSQEIAETMKAELQQRVESAGLVIEEVRITHLAYAEEIAAAMLQRQQAAAIIAAKQKIVDGAVGMVKMAVDKLGEDDVIVLDEERKAQMVSNLLVVLCGSRDAQPIVNSGSIF